jgi:predicted  nucleic acid-binding Zn-ribbon protein
MSQASSELLIATIQTLSHDLDAIDNQLQTLENEGMNQILPWRYLALQPRVDSLIQKQHALQDAWNKAMNELARCRSDASSHHHP